MKRISRPPLLCNCSPPPSLLPLPQHNVHQPPAMVGGHYVVGEGETRVGGYLVCVGPYMHPPKAPTTSKRRTVAICQCLPDRQLHTPAASPLHTAPLHVRPICTPLGLTVISQSPLLVRMQLQTQHMHTVWLATMTLPAKCMLEYQPLATDPIKGPAPACPL